MTKAGREAFCAAVDELVGWPPFATAAARGEGMYRASARVVLEGLWVGANVQPIEYLASSGWMIVKLRQAGADLTGQGRDPTGRFEVAGRVDDASGRVAFLKSYTGARIVTYSGLVSAGALHGCSTLASDTYWGVWALRPAGVFPDDVIEALEERAHGVTLQQTFGVVVRPWPARGRVADLVRDFERLDDLNGDVRGR